ncbi:3-hydroxyacyl-ACP dehydratase FabZ family protein [Helicobacter cinaedi]|uniref:3-hydroxyacyl-ACP dehydratase FabZ family protein n=3 Tax=Helicobacter cinaedi TaxID=213 RepID=UPI000DA18B4E|nr:3-hydroxyacyl-ACP dehydratase FabZ family protein [Helicobacter cinaedi]
MRTLLNLDSNEIQKYQQNRYPLLFVDFIKEVKVGETALGYKTFSYNEWYFPAHFEDEPNVPGFVQMEALTQVFLMTFLTMDENKGKKTAFVQSNTEFRKKIIPGDMLEIRARLDSYKRGVAKGSVKGYLHSIAGGGGLACQANLIIAIPDVLSQYKPG